MIEKRWYLKIALKEKCDGRKIWYMNDEYICYCVNLPFLDKEKCESNIPRIKRIFKENIESITLHYKKFH